MSRTIDRLEQLRQLAKLRSDMELRRFSAFRNHVTAMRDKIDGLQQDLAALYHVDAAFSFSVPEAQLVNAMAGDLARQMIRTETELQQMLPGFEAARQDAVREFGRADVLKQIRKNLIAEQKQQAQKKLASL